jgi:hypothetical protein
MHQISLHTLAATAIIAMAIPLTAQISPCQQTAPCPVNPPKPPKLLSFTAEIKIHSVQTLADGTTITRDSKEQQARDSQNRYFSSRTNPFAIANEAADAFVFSNAHDPVDGTQTNWDSRTRKATVLKMPSRDQQHGCWASSSGGRWNFGPMPPQPRPAPSLGIGTGGGFITGAVASVGPSGPPPVRPRPTNEDLGTAVIMGLEAHGTRMTITTPVGAIGNDKPLVRTTETWTAPGLPTPLRQISSDPRTGTETREVVSLDLSEPPLSTFQPPEGYEITVDELHEVPCQTAP